MFFRKMVICITSVMFAFTVYSQPSQWPKTFLWRISGNGLSKPSFLYGTIHLSDKKLFYFSDSLYQYLQQAEGFNIEVDADTLVAVSLRKWAEKDKGRTLKSLMNKNEYEKYSDKLAKTLNKPADKITTKDVWLAKNKKTAEAFRKGDMSSFMDLYLYGIAKRLGKKTGGIEDIEDQMDAIDEMFDETDVEYLVSDSAGQQTNSIVEKMKNIYVLQDLNKVHALFNNIADGRFRDIVMLRRNVKMARRMDSLSHERSNFFAVGVGHLPGDSGVIDLLRKRGFNVEPVFSVKKIAPENYKFKEVVVSWQQFTHDLQLYKVEIPGTLQTMDMFKQVMDMRYYYDLANAKVYFTAVVNSVTDSTKKDSVFSAMIKRMATKGSNILSKKSIVKQGFEGREVMMTSSDGDNLRMNVYMAEGLVYMAMVSTKGVDKLHDKDTRRFFESFSMTPHPSFSKPYISYSDPTNAFSVSLPDQPAISEEAETEEAGDYKSYSAHDYNSGNYYLITIRNTKAGNYIPDDSSYLELVRTNLAAAMRDDTTAYQTIYAGFPALAFNGTPKAENSYYRTITLLRGNRVYTLMGVSNKATARNLLVDSFFKSFKLLDYPATVWRQVTAPDSSFAAWLPAQFEAPEKEEEASDIDGKISDTTISNDRKNQPVRIDFVSQDKANATSYNISRSGFEEYYWAINDSVFFRKSAERFKSEGDSIVAFRLSQLQNDRIADAEIVHSNSSIVKKIRFILHNDSLYKVYSYSPRWLLKDENNQKFFSDFAIASPGRPSTLFNNKTSLLTADLTSSDSATFEKASSYVRNADLAESELRSFHPLIVKPLKDFDDGFYNTNVKLTEKVTAIADSSTVDFILQQYPQLKHDSRKLQYILLKLLVETKQPYAAEAVKKLIALPAAPGGNAAIFASALLDTLPLAKTLFPHIISFTKDTTAALKYARLIKRLVDSSLVTKEDVLASFSNFVAAAEQQKNKIKKDNDDFDYNLGNVLDLFGTLNSAPGNEQLQAYSKVNNLYITYLTTNWLIQNKQPLSAEAINKLAASNEYRTLIYDTLKAVDKENLFPGAYHTQKMFAASYLHSYAAEDDSYPDSLKYLMEKIVTYKNKKQKFYLFKVSFNDGENISHSLGISGPFALDPKKVTSENEATGVYWKEEFSNKKVNFQFNEYLKQVESSE